MVVITNQLSFKMRCAVVKQTEFLMDPLVIVYVHLLAQIMIPQETTMDVLRTRRIPRQ